MVVEVDHTMDVRRGRLGGYQEGGPEVWVLVPERDTRIRSARRRPGLTIHVREGGQHRTANESRAFPGWRVEEINAAKNETRLTAAASVVPERVGRVLRGCGRHGTELRRKREARHGIRHG